MRRRMSIAIRIASIKASKISRKIDSMKCVLDGAKNDSSREMKLAILYVCAFLCALVCCHGPRRRKVRVREEPKNNLFFEKFKYTVLDRSLIPKDWIDIRPIAPNVYRLNTTITVAQTLNELWYSGVLYYKYNTYQKYLIGFKYEMCALMDAILDGNDANPYTKIIMDNTAQFMWDSDMETKLQYKCPIEPGELYVRHKSLNASRFSLPLMQAGRYRLNLFTQTSEHASPFMSGELYFRISDLRVWF